MEGWTAVSASCKLAGNLFIKTNKQIFSAQFKTYCLMDQTTVCFCLVVVLQRLSDCEFIVAPLPGIYQADL